ncbi:MAG: hypothetical protein GKR90_25880 [Pseudomonadales bacterium]|nr:hypothetical protein [Pseudomonadales bacterium]
MNWDAIGAIADLTVEISVIASLAYVATRIRPNTRASALQSKLATAGTLSEFVDMLITDPELNDIFMRGRASTESLSKEERQRFSNMVMNTFWICSSAHFQLRTGTLSEEDWLDIKTTLDYWIAGAGVRAWWRRHGHESFGKTYAAFVDAEVARSAANSGAD